MTTSECLEKEKKKRRWDFALVARSLTESEKNTDHLVEDVPSNAAPLLVRQNVSGECLLRDGSSNGTTGCARQYTLR